MKAYSRNCRLKGYEDTYDWYFAWDKYLRRNENLLKEVRYEDLLRAAEYIYVCHRMAQAPENSLADMRKICRSYVSLAKNEDRFSFVLTDEVGKYLISIAGIRNELPA